METDRQYNEFLKRYSPNKAKQSGEPAKKHKRPYRHSPNKPEARFEGTKPQVVLSEEVKARQEAYQLKRALRHGGGKFRKAHKG
jgi:hypothetical protein